MTGTGLKKCMLLVRAANKAFLAWHSPHHTLAGSCRTRFSRASESRQ